jgi:hypothetical protein
MDVINDNDDDDVDDICIFALYMLSSSGWRGQLQKRLPAYLASA